MSDDSIVVMQECRIVGLSISKETMFFFALRGLQRERCQATAGVATTGTLTL